MVSTGIQSLTMAHATEREMVERAKEDPQAFADLYDIHFDRIWSYVLRRVADAEAAKDIVAATFFKALRGLPAYEYRDIPLSAWLYRIAGNEIRMHARKRRFGMLSLDRLRDDGGFDVFGGDLADEVEEIEAFLERESDFLAAQRRLLELPHKYQEVIALRFFEEKKVSDIAAILGKKEGTVKSLLSRGLKLLGGGAGDGAQPFRRPGILKDEGREGFNSFNQSI